MLTFLVMAAWAGAGALGMLFLVAGVGKLGDVAAFAAEVASYRLVPLGWAYPLARVLAMVQALLGMWLLSGVFAQGAGVLAAVLLAAFAAGMGVNVLRGRTDLDCGCIPGVKTALSWASVGRNLVLALVGLLVAGATLRAEGLPQAGFLHFASFLHFECLVSGACLTVLILAIATLRLAEART